MWWEIIIVLAFVLLVAIYLYWKHKIKTNVGDIAREAMPLWASFSPFENGDESAAVLYYSYWATQGKKFADGLAENNLYTDHAKYFDSDRDGWDKVIEQSSKVSVSNIDNKRRLVKALYELDRMKDEGNLPEWDSYYALGHIVTSKDNAAAIDFYNYLQRVMEENSEIESEVNNLIEDYVIYNDIKIDITMSAGLLAYVCLKHARNNPSQEISKTILSLNDKTFEMFNEKNDKPGEPSEQELKDQIMTEVHDFAESHPYFDELSDKIVLYINDGVSLEDAYNRALHEKLNDIK